MGSRRVNCLSVCWKRINWTGCWYSHAPSIGRIRCVATWSVVRSGARPFTPTVALSLIHISEPTRLRRISYAVFCLKKKNLRPNMTESLQVVQGSLTDHAIHVQPRITLKISQRILSCLLYTSDAADE